MLTTESAFALSKRSSTPLTNANLDFEATKDDRPPIASGHGRQKMPSEPEAITVCVPLLLGCRFETSLESIGSSQLYLTD